VRSATLRRNHRAATAAQPLRFLPPKPSPAADLPPEPVASPLTSQTPVPHKKKEAQRPPLFELDSDSVPALELIPQRHLQNARRTSSMALAEIFTSATFTQLMTSRDQKQKKGILHVEDALFHEYRGCYSNSSRLELDAQRQLDDAGLRHRAGALAKLQVVDVLVPKKEYRMIQNVERFGSERQFEAFRESEVLLRG